MSYYFDNVKKLNAWLERLHESHLSGYNIPAMHNELTDCELLSVLKDLLGSRCFNYAKINFSTMLGVDFNGCENQTGINQSEVDKRVVIPSIFCFGKGTKDGCDC